MGWAVAKRSRLLTIGIPFALVALAAIYVGSVSLSARADTDGRTLLLPENLATNTALGAGKARATSKQPGFGAASSWSRTWSLAGGAVLTQQVRRYGQPGNAEFRYLVDHPKDEYERGFEEKDASDRYDSPHADRSTLFCATGSRTGCRNWIYWARYGQYLVQLELGVADRDVPVETFAAVLKVLDGHIGPAS